MGIGFAEQNTQMEGQMKLHMGIVLTALLVLPGVGCNSADKKLDDTAAALGYKERPLEEEWRPLERIRERPDMLAPDTRVTTIGRTVYVADIKKWVGEHPVGSPEWKSVLRHEQEHSKRQLKVGVLKWVAKYAYDRKFMWLEEQIGWWWGIKVLRQHGKRIVPEGVAVNLESYKNLTGRMVSYEDALAWVKAVLANKWKPPE